MYGNKGSPPTNKHDAHRKNLVNSRSRFNSILSTLIFLIFINSKANASSTPQTISSSPIKPSNISAIEIRNTTDTEIIEKETEKKNVGQRTTEFIKSLKTNKSRIINKSKSLFGGSKLTFSTSFSISFQKKVSRDIISDSSAIIQDDDGNYHDSISLVDDKEDVEEKEDESEFVSNLQIDEEKEKEEVDEVNISDVSVEDVSEDGNITSSQDDQDQEAIEVDSADDEIDVTTMNLTFPLLQPGDGHEEDEDGIPSRYLKMQRNNRHLANASYHHSVEWREEHNIDTILSRPNTKYDLCKAILPHYFPGHDVQGNIIFVQKLGKLDIQKCHQLNVTTEEILSHYVYIMEYCWNIIIKDEPNAVMTNILDLQGLSFGFNMLFRDKQMISLIKKIIKLMSEQYPSRSYKTFIIHAPAWFQLMYRVVKPLLRDSTKKKILIYSSGAGAMKKMKSDLKEYLGDDVRLYYDLLDQSDRDELVASNAIVIDDNLDSFGVHSVIEQELRSFCTKHIEKAGLHMEEVSTINLSS